MITKVLMKLNSPKKYSARYDAADAEGEKVLRSVYIGYPAIGTKLPQTIEVTINTGGDTLDK